MKAFTLGIAAACLAIGAASAQPATGTQSTTGSTGATAAVTPAPTTPDQPKPSGDSNPAIVTTASNAATPAHGANSFTSGEAQGRIEKNGFTNVSDLRKDEDGVWRGRAQKNGAPVNVWLDYRGSVGQQ